MAIYVNEKERVALLDACDFISTNADGAIDQTMYQEMQEQLMSLFYKVKKDHEMQYRKRLVKKYLKQAANNKKP